MWSLYGLMIWCSPTDGVPVIQFVERRKQVFPYTHVCSLTDPSTAWRSDSGISWSSKQSRAVLNKPINWTATIDASLLRFDYFKLLSSLATKVYNASWRS
ncbi:hypothetical protein EV363DRAFT_487244 [Boletus edulis]|nr:hypothetical protein EV363DRAFT_487244 [Boletus edulis]